MDKISSLSQKLTQFSLNKLKPIRPIYQPIYQQAFYKFACIEALLSNDYLKDSSQKLANI